MKEQNTYHEKPLLLCLHGWGGSRDSFTELREALKGTDIEILTPDLPGFGNEPEPSEPYTVDDYVKWVLRWLQTELGTRNSELDENSTRINEQTNKRTNVYVLGHSHGGRILIKLLSNLDTYEIRNTKYIIRHTFLCAAAGIHHPRHIKRVIGLTLAKGGKVMFKIPGLRKLEPIGKKLLYKLVRVHDYERANEVMRKTLINVSKEDLRPLLRDITVPVDLFWGTDDGMTPYSDAKVMEAEIPNATLHTYEGIRHRVHRDRAREIARKIKEILQKNAIIYSIKRLQNCKVLFVLLRRPPPCASESGRGDFGSCTKCTDHLRVIVRWRPQRS